MNLTFFVGEREGRGELEFSWDVPEMADSWHFITIYYDTGPA